mmetsp:Transcript_106936/g.312718  ORF Transcript_106936/g.312718 Transcript_106936/m.312718 type:complete len:331 (-) Transcript_106936:147-1139(-)
MFFPGMMYGGMGMGYGGMGMGPMGMGMGPMGMGAYNAGMQQAMREQTTAMRNQMPDMEPPKEPLVLIRRNFEEAELKPGKVVVLYFASSSQESRGFTATLRRFHEHVKSSGKPIEIIYVSSEKTEPEFRHTFSKEHGEWLAVAWKCHSWRDGMAKQYSVQGVPDLVVVNDKGDAVRRGVVQEVREASSSKERALATFSLWRTAVGDAVVEADAVIPKAADLRAARLAALERRAAGAGSAGAGAAGAGAGSASGQAPTPPPSAAPSGPETAAFPAPRTEPSHDDAASLLGAQEQEGSAELDPEVRRMRLAALDRMGQREGDKRNCCMCIVQ